METLIHKARKRFRGCTDIFKMAKKGPKFYILCLSNCYFESILIPKERNGKYLNPLFYRHCKASGGFCQAQNANDCEKTE